MADLWPLGDAIAQAARAAEVEEVACLAGDAQAVTDSLVAENARLRERVAMLEEALREVNRG